MPETRAIDRPALSLVVRDDDADELGVTNPRTGEIVPLREGASDELAALLEDLAMMASMVSEAKGEVDQELIRRMDLDGRWTADVGGYRLKSSSPSAGVTYYDADELARVLERLVKQGKISQAAADAALEQPPPPPKKVRKAGVNALIKIGPAIARAIKRAERTNPPARRSVKVERPRP